MIARFKQFLKQLPRRTKWIIGGAILLVLIIFFVFRGNGNGGAETFVVTKRDVVQKVNVSGQVKPASTVDLGFGVGGRVAASYVAVGDKVVVGKRLATLSAGDLAAQVREAEANVKSSEAKLSELKRGTRTEDIALYESKVASAKALVANARINLHNVLADAYTKADDAVSGRIDQLFSNPHSADPKLAYTNANLQLQIDLELGRYAAGLVLADWRTQTLDANDSSFIQFVKDSLGVISGVLSNAARFINSLSSSSSLSQVTLDGFKVDIVTARTNVNAAISNLSTAEEKLRSAETALVVSERELLVKKAGSTAEELLSGEAEVERAKAAADNIRAQLAKTVIIAPISGVVARQDADAGEFVSAGTSLISLISASDFEIEASIPEADIAKVSLGQSARVVLDAYGSENPFEARVVRIDPAETIIDSVSTYKIELQFAQKDDRIRSGMTASIEIESKRNAGVLAIPQRFVTSRDGKRFVKVGSKPDNATEVEVSLGLRGSDSFSEVAGGLSEGDTIISQ
ncbi:MAG: efflux RND transporter periplasmic adaptor subunit [Patescibacteria group bacterium]